MLTPQIDTLNQQIAQLELEKSGLSNIDPYELERRIQEHAARAIPGLDGAPEALKVLQQLIASKEQVVQHQARRIAIDNELRGLRIQRDAEIADQARYELEAMNKEFDTAAAEFDMLVRNMCRAYYRMHKINLKNASRNPRYQRRSLADFNVPALNPHGWIGSTSQMIRDGSLPWVKE